MVTALQRGSGRPTRVRRSVGLLAGLILLVIAVFVAFELSLPVRVVFDGCACGQARYRFDSILTGIVFSPAGATEATVCREGATHAEHAYWDGTYVDYDRFAVALTAPRALARRIGLECERYQ